MSAPQPDLASAHPSQHVWVDEATFRDAVVNGSEGVTIIPNPHVQKPRTLLDRDGHRCVVPTIELWYLTPALDANYKPTGKIASYFDQLPLLGDGTLDHAGTMLGFLKGKHPYTFVFMRDIA